MKIGILGTGQLAYLFGLVSEKCGHEIVPFGPESIPILADYTQPFYGDFSDEKALAEFATGIDVLTYETETIALEVLEFCAQYVPIYPAMAALKTAQDRLFEKRMFNDLQIPTNNFYNISSADDLSAAAELIGFPSIIKTRTDGYDGKGQYVLNSLEELKDAWQNLNQLPCILESFVNYQREVSIVATRDQFNTVQFFPLTQNYHKNGILRYSFPSLSDPLQQQAEAYAKKIMTHLDYVGCMAIEFFDVNGELYTNEMAPRVHNSGHWTLEGATMSQFEMHLRAISGEAIAAPSVTDPVVMANIIGTEVNTSVLASAKGVQLYDYGKTLKPNRKMGHFTLAGTDSTEQVLLELVDVYKNLEEADLAGHIENFLKS